MTGTIRNLQERFYWAERLSRMHYGKSFLIRPDVAARCWPPTGDHDRSFEGTFRGLALVAGGHRPETSMTTLERIQRDLDDDGSFEVEPRHTAEGTGYVVRRLVQKCPRCRGSGWLSPFERNPCDHRPEKAR